MIHLTQHEVRGVFKSPMVKDLLRETVFSSTAVKWSSCQMVHHSCLQGLFCSVHSLPQVTSLVPAWHNGMYLTLSQGCYTRAI